MIEGKPTTVNLEKKHVDFLFEQSRHFNFSAFVRDKLNDYMRLVEKKEEIENEGDRLKEVYGEVQVVEQDAEISSHEIVMDKLRGLQKKEVKCFGGGIEGI